MASKASRPDAPDVAETPSRAARPSRLEATRPDRPEGSRRAASMSASIHRALRAEIVALSRRPGDQIIEADVARAFGASRTPVREAVLKLADEGLIDIFPQSGTFVAPIPLDEIPDAIAIRRLLEEDTARAAASVADASQVARLRAALAEQRAREAAADHEGFHAADEGFHALVAAIAGRERFWQVVLQTKTQVDRFRRLTLPGAGRMGAVVAEHAAVVDAIASADGDAAAAAVRVHLDALLASLAFSQRAYPGMFTRSHGAGRAGRALDTTARTGGAPTG